MKRMEEDNQVNAYLVTDKYPKQISQMKSKLKYYEEVTQNKALGQTELTNYRARVSVRCGSHSYEFVAVRVSRLAN
jgi:hypothetical protein